MGKIKKSVLTKLLLLSSKLFSVKTVSNNKEREIFAKTWRDVWLEVGYYDYPEQPILRDFLIYNRASVDILLKFLGIFPAGTFRFTHYYKEIGLPVLKDFEVKRIWESDNIMEATLFSVTRKYRKFPVPHLASCILMREMVRYGIKNNLEGSVMMVDKRLFFAMRDILCFPIHQIGPEKFYVGSTTYPAFIRTSEFVEKMKENNPFFLT